MKESKMFQSNQELPKKEEKSKLRKFIEKAAVVGTAGIALGGAMELQPKHAEAQENRYEARYNPNATERIKVLNTIKVFKQLGYENTRKWQDNENEYFEYLTPKGKEIVTVPIVEEVAKPKYEKQPFHEEGKPVSEVGGPTEVAGPKVINERK